MKPTIKSLWNDGESYLVFTKDHDVADAKRCFLNRFGYRADGVVQTKDGYGLGPIEPKSLMAGLA